MAPKAETVAVVVQGVEFVLFDLDGPLCSVFANVPPAGVARQLESLIGRQFDTDDPLEVARRSVELGPDAVAAVDDALTAAELKAIDSAVATDGGVAAVRAAVHSGARVGVVSNNSAAAAHQFLASTGLADLVSVVVGRAVRQPQLMKPHSWPMRQALSALRAAADGGIFVGDSSTDVEASHAVGMRCVGYANKPGKRERLAGADAVIESMTQLVEAFGRRQPTR